MWNVGNGCKYNFKDMLAFTDREGILKIAVCFSPILDRGYESNCHPKEIDILLIGVGTNV